LLFKVSNLLAATLRFSGKNNPEDSSYHVAASLLDSSKVMYSPR
jgi:hypothetical protein